MSAKNLKRLQGALSLKDKLAITTQTDKEKKALIQDLVDFLDERTASTNPKEYIAILTQVGTNAPTATVLKNTYDSTVEFAYDTTGEYRIIFSSAELTAGKTIIIPPSNSASTLAVSEEWFASGRNSSTEMYLSSGIVANATGVLTASDDVLTGAASHKIIIQTYPS